LIGGGSKTLSKGRGLACRVAIPYDGMEVSTCSEAAQCVRRQREWKVMCEQVIGRVRSVLPDFV
jgi:hypothetical protein